MNRAPQFLGLDAIDHVTYYQWMDLQQCALKGAIPVFKLDGTLPGQVPTRAVLVGRFHHRAMELAVSASSVAELVEQIDEEITRLQATVSEWAHLKRSGSVSGWDEVNRSASLARRIASHRGGRSSGRVQHVERELKSRDGRLVGRPDFVSIGASNAVLREYKSGPIREPDGQLVPTHVDQLLFYSYLIFENFDVERVVGHLEALTGDTQEVTIERQQAHDFAADVVRRIRRINAELLANRDPMDLALPSKRACTGCAARIVCSKFKSEQDHLGLEGSQFVVEGRVRSVCVSPTADITDVVISDYRRQSTNSLLIPTRECEGLSAGACCLIVDLRRHGGNLVWDHTSRVFRCD